jgi:hypothetical protein
MSQFIKELDKNGQFLNTFFKRIPIFAVGSK